MSAGLLPSSFDVRGISLPLTTPIFAFARLRKLPTGLVVTLPSYEQSGQIYQIPIDKMEAILSLSVFDRALFEKLPDLLEPGPEDIRDQVAEIEKTGLAGARAMRHYREEQERQAETGPPAPIRPSLLASTIRQLANKEYAVEDLATELDQEAAMDDLVTGFEDLNISTEQGVERLKLWSQLISPLSGPEQNEPGPIQDILTRMEDLSQELRRWLIHEPVAPAELAQLTSLAMDHTLKQARQHSAQLDNLFHAIGEKLSQWDETENLLRDKLRHLENLADGWGLILDRWEEAGRGEYYEQREALIEFFPHLPVLPADQPGLDMAFWEGLTKTQVKWARQSTFYENLNEQQRAALNQYARAAA